MVPAPWQPSQKVLEAALPTEFGLFPQSQPFLASVCSPWAAGGGREAAACSHTRTDTHTEDSVTCTCHGGCSPWPVGHQHCSFNQRDSSLPTGCILLLQQAGVRGAGIPGAGDRQQGGGVTCGQTGQGKGATDRGDTARPGKGEVVSDLWVLPSPPWKPSPAAPSSPLLLFLGRSCLFSHRL